MSNVLKNTNEKMLSEHTETFISPIEKALEPNEQVKIDLTAPLAGSDEMDQQFGIKGNLVATVNAGSQRFMIVDTRDTPSNRDFFVVDDNFSMQDRVGFKGVPEDSPVIIGRAHYADRFQYPATVSKEHFEVEYKDEGLFIRNLRPTNNTVLTAHVSVEQGPGLRAFQHSIQAERTRLAECRLQDNPNFGEKDDTAPYGYYLNHPILGRASKSVDGGVYLGGSAREAIVVDGKSQAMKQAYQDLDVVLRQSLQRQETLQTKVVLTEVMRHVQEIMPYEANKAEDIGQQHRGDQLVGLSTYLKERAGVCRHQALLTAYIVENLIKDGYITGEVGVERNTVAKLGGSHAWAIYKTANNGSEEVIVIDPAQSFVGTKAQAQKEGNWEYRLPSDQY